eukprot:15461243-Alexandrium_andersonii.AAC.1
MADRPPPGTARAGLRTARAARRCRRAPSRGLPAVVEQVAVVPAQMHRHACADHQADGDDRPGHVRHVEVDEGRHQVAVVGGLEGKH